MIATRSGRSCSISSKGVLRFHYWSRPSKPTYPDRTPNASIMVRGQSSTCSRPAEDDRVAAASPRRYRGDAKALSTSWTSRVSSCVTSNGSVGVPVNRKGLPGHEDAPFDTAFPFVANAQIDPVPTMERAVIVDGTFPCSAKTCTNPGSPKLQKADDDSRSRRSARRQ